MTEETKEIKSDEDIKIIELQNECKSIKIDCAEAFRDYQKAVDISYEKNRIYFKLKEKYEKIDREIWDIRLAKENEIKNRNKPKKKEVISKSIKKLLDKIPEDKLKEMIAKYNESEE